MRVIPVETGRMSYHPFTLQDARVQFSFARNRNVEIEAARLAVSVNPVGKVDIDVVAGDIVGTFSGSRVDIVTPAVLGRDDSAVEVMQIGGVLARLVCFLMLAWLAQLMRLLMLTWFAQRLMRLLMLARPITRSQKVYKLRGNGIARSRPDDGRQIGIIVVLGDDAIAADLDRTGIDGEVDLHLVAPDLHLVAQDLLVGRLIVARGNLAEPLETRI